MSIKVSDNIQDLPDEPQRFLSELANECGLLLVLKKEIYEGEWRPMIADLKNRLTGKPYVFKLANRIEDDLSRIERMQKLEQTYGIDLSVYVEPLTSTEKAE